MCVCVLKVLVLPFVAEDISNPFTCPVLAVLLTVLAMVVLVVVSKDDNDVDDDED